MILALPVENQYHTFSIILGVFVEKRQHLTTILQPYDFRVACVVMEDRKRFTISCRLSFSWDRHRHYNVDTLFKIRKDYIGVGSKTNIVGGRSSSDPKFWHDFVKKFVPTLVHNPDPISLNITYLFNVCLHIKRFT